MTEDLDSLRQRFERFVDRAGEHHRWTGAIRPDTGVGRLKVDGRHIPAPHIAWTLAIGPIPSGVRIRPCASDPACVRIEHLHGPDGAGARSRSRKGAGSMREVGAGIWELSVTAGRYDDGRPRRHFRRVGARSKSQASKLLAAFAAEVHDLPAITPRSVVEQTFNDAVRNYLDSHLGEEKGREPKTIDDYWRLHEKWFAPVLGRRHPSEIESSHMDARFGAMRRAGLSRSRMNQARSLYAPFFRWAKANRLVDRNPMLDFQLPTSSHVSRERTPPEVDELCELLNAALFVIPDVAPLLTLGAVSGMRRGELAAVRRGRVSWTDATIRIDAAIDAGRRVKRTKTRKERTIAVDDATIEMLRRHCAAMDARAALAGIAGDVSILRTALITIGIVSASVWIGSLVCLAAVSAVARRELTGSARVTLFRGVGRLYRIVGTASLLTTIATGIVLAWPITEVGRTLGVMFWLSGALLVITALGMDQARRMTVARQRLLARPKDEDIAETVRRGAAVAAVLRSAIGVVTFIIVVLGASLLEG